MPEYKLTQEEKNRIIARHKELVDELNNYLPEGNKLEYDKNLEARLEDEKEVKYYRTLEEAQLRIAKQKQIYAQLIEEYGDLPAERLYLPRTFEYAFRTDDTDEAKEYNENLYIDYINNPEKVFYARYRKVLEFAPENIYELLDDDQKAVEFYLNNQALCEDGFAFSSAMSNANIDINPELLNAVSGIKNNIETTLSYPMVVTRRDMGLDSYVFPKLTKEQAEAIIGSNPVYMVPEHPFRQQFSNALDENKNDTDNLLNFYKTNGYKLGKNFFVKYIAERHDPRTNKTAEIGLDAGIKEMKTNGENICVRERSADEIFNLKRIDDAYDRQYLEIWERNFSNNYNHKPFDFEEIRDANKGKLFERLFKTTSREYQRFIEALGEFQDPGSPGYMNKAYLKQTAIAYFEHKTEEGVSFSKIDSTGQERLKLVSAVIKTITDMDNNQQSVDNEINGVLIGKDEVKQPIKNPEIDDNLFDNKIEKDNNVITNEVSLEK